MNEKPTIGQEVTGADGLIYKCVFAGDNIRTDGVPVKSELWETVPEDEIFQYARSLSDYLNNVFEGAVFHSIVR